MKQSYRSPALVEYGRIHEVTLGASGTKPDAIVSLGPPMVVTPNPDNPSCNNNVPSGYCYSFAR